jgi:hypothetical protein
MMNHGAMLWNAAGYNNGAINRKDAIVGQGYGADGVALTLNNPFKPTPEETKKARHPGDADSAPAFQHFPTWQSLPHLRERRRGAVDTGRSAAR